MIWKTFSQKNFYLFTELNLNLLDCFVSSSASSVGKARPISGLCLARDCSIRATIYLGATPLDKQALTKAAKNFKSADFSSSSVFNDHEPSRAQRWDALFQQMMLKS